MRKNRFNEKSEVRKIIRNNSGSKGEWSPFQSFPSFLSPVSTGDRRQEVFQVSSFYSISKCTHVSCCHDVSCDSECLRIRIHTHKNRFRLPVRSLRSQKARKSLEEEEEKTQHKQQTGPASDTATSSWSTLVHALGRGVPHGKG